MAEEQTPEIKKEWQRAGAGEVPKVGERVSTKDGDGIVDDTHGHTVQVKLDNGFFWRGGIDVLWVLR